MAITGKHSAVTGNKSSPIAGSDFIILGKPKLQMNVLCFGSPGTGKTSLATRFAPDPVALINFDRRANHAVAESMKQGRKIFLTQVDTPANVSKLGDEAAKKIGQAAVDKVVKNFELAVRESQKGNVRCIAIDTGTEYAEIVNLSLTGKAIGVKGDYGKSKDLLNREFWRLFNLAREGNAHFILLARTKEVWVGGEPSGTFTYRGPSIMDEGVDWSAHIRLRKGSKGRSKPQFEMEITKAGLNIEELGSVYREDDWDGLGGPFVYSCYMQHLNIGSDIEDWQ